MSREGAGACSSTTFLTSFSVVNATVAAASAAKTRPRPQPRPPRHPRPRPRPPPRTAPPPGPRPRPRPPWMRPRPRPRPLRGRWTPVSSSVDAPSAGGLARSADTTPWPRAAWSAPRTRPRPRPRPRRGRPPSPCGHAARTAAASPCAAHARDEGSAALAAARAGAGRATGASDGRARRRRARRAARTHARVRATTTLALSVHAGHSLLVRSAVVSRAKPRAPATTGPCVGKHDGGHIRTHVSVASQSRLSTLFDVSPHPTMFYSAVGWFCQATGERSPSRSNEHWKCRPSCGLKSQVAIQAWTVPVGGVPSWAMSPPRRRRRPRPACHPVCPAVPEPRDGH